MKKLVWILSLLSLLSQPVYSWHGELLIEEGGGWLQGYTQIPKGGDYNTTSYQRPSYEEADLSHDLFFHAQGSLYHRAGFIFIDYFRFTPHKIFTLSQDLITHSRFIPAGSPFDMSVHYDWYQLGIGFDTLDYFEKWHLQPALVASWIKFHYQFWAPTAQSQRHFNLMTPSLKLSAERQLSPQWALELVGEASVPVTALTLFNAKIGLNYSLALTSNIVLYPCAFLGMLFLDYEDHQKVPNHFRYQLTPYISFGIKL